MSEGPMTIEQERDELEKLVISKCRIYEDVEGPRLSPRAVANFIMARDTRREVEILRSLLDSDHGCVCICQRADTKVCDHNWSLCHDIRDRVEDLVAQLSSSKKEGEGDDARG